MGPIPGAAQSLSSKSRQSPECLPEPSLARPHSNETPAGQTRARPRESNTGAIRRMGSGPPRIASQPKESRKHVRRCFRSPCVCVCACILCRDGVQIDVSYLENVFEEVELLSKVLHGEQAEPNVLRLVWDASGQVKVVNSGCTVPLPTSYEELRRRAPRCSLARKRHERGPRASRFARFRRSRCSPASCAS